jgi:hypothetical protein
MYIHLTKERVCTESVAYYVDTEQIDSDDIP